MPTGNPVTIFMQLQEDNSIFTALVGNVDSFISIARQEIDSPDVGDRLFWIVEGVDDESFFQQFFNDSDVRFYYPKGCEKVRRLIEELDAFYPDKLYAIVDSDFNELNGIAESRDNIFRTDWHDHEMWLIYRPGSLEMVYQSFSVNPDDYEYSAILPEAVEGIRNLSYIKWYHDKVKREAHDTGCENAEGLNFGKSPMVHHFGKKVGESLAYIYSRQRDVERKIVITEADVAAFMSQNSGIDPRHLNVGHDLINALTHLIHKYHPHNIVKGEVYNKLKANYGLDDFITTDTYRKISDYFSAHSLPSPLKTVTP